jgi:hypothetical protein
MLLSCERFDSISFAVFTFAQEAATLFATKTGRDLHYVARMALNAQLKKWSPNAVTVEESQMVEALRRPARNTADADTVMGEYLTKVAFERKAGFD